MQCVDSGKSRFECPECGNRFSRDAEVAPCGICSTVCGDAEEINPPENDEIRIYCERCGFEETVDKRKCDVDRPSEYAKGKASLHSSNRGHPTRIVTSFESENVSDKGMKLPGIVESENDLQHWLESYFEDNGWTAIREVSPHASKYRADLIVQCDDYGWIGIETKFFDSDGGAKAAKAHHQITRKYRNKNYIGRKIDLWAICPYFKYMNSDSRLHSREQNFRSQFIREFFCRHGIGYIDLDRPDLLIDFAYSQPIAKIPVDCQEDSRYYENVNIDEIRDAVSNKMERCDYK